MRRERLFTLPFVLCSASNLSQGLGFNLFLHLPGFLDDIGASKVMIGFLFGLASGAGILVRPAIGRRMDARGRRGVILWGCALNVAVCTGYLAVDHVGPLLVGIRIVHGLSAAMLFTSLFTLAADHVPASRRTEGLALFGVSGMVSIAMGGELGDWILPRGGYTALFQAAVAFGAGSFLLALGLRDRERPDPHEDERPRGFTAALRQRDLLPLWWMGAVFATVLACNFGFLNVFVRDTGLGSVGGFFTAYSGAAIVMRVLFGWLPDRAGPKRVLYPSLLALAAGFAVLAGADTARDVTLAGVLCGMGHGYTFPILFGMVVTRARDADRGSAMAIYTALFDTGIVLGGPIFGWVIERAGYSEAFLAAAGVVAAGSVVFAVWDRRR
jgi:predicted MFS family arabinose efflux permease